MITVKKKNLCLKIIIFSLIGLSSCNISSNNFTAVTEKQERTAPSDVVTAFFQAAGNSESLEEFERPYPDSFTECLLKTPSECAEEKQKSQQLNPTGESKLPRVVVSEKPEVSILVTRFSKKIASKSIILKRKIFEWTKNNEARVRVEVEINGISEIKDFLLFKDTKWRIFEIAREDEHPNYATPSGKAELSL
ncbi:MAG TPA: hypothetical protein VNB22_07645 [Pyrinomonadaceae bacterium]|jgi:hypothetical protein|nr:hypothetical protein [Pyrinomonadaceae bacterium]